MEQAVKYTQLADRNERVRARMNQLLDLLQESRGLATNHIMWWLKEARPSVVRADLERLLCDGLVSRTRVQDIFDHAIMRELHIRYNAWFWEPCDT